MSSRPVYIPSRKRKQKQPRFHGAFTGGFSAGHFNTVADESAEGFVPKQEESDIRRQQKPEDFMDDQDHNEWGGPSSVKEEYAIAAAAPNNSSSGFGGKSDSNNAMLDLVKPPAQNVGHRLLRILGWRDGSTAYVPCEEKETTSAGDSSIESLLSSKRLKRIQLQQARVKLPSPKLDTCGLGYDSYENAPEFRAHRERRRKEAQERAKAVTASSAENRNVYRLSNLLDDNDEKRQSHTTNHDEEDDPLVSFETEQSFVGTKTVGGFALREDDDDVYDDHVKVSKSNRDEYDTVVYEHASDDENDHDTKRTETSDDLGSVFASWAASRDGKGSKSPSRGVTSDGRLPLAGFVLGASTTFTKVERYPGPDLPSGYEPKRHEFGNNEYPSELKEETKALQKSLLDERRKTIQQERKAEIRKVEEKRESGPMANAAFAGLAVAMKNRFTPSAPEPPATQHGQPAAIGLHRPSKDSSIAPFPREPVPTPKPITITRTTMTFVPESLLCKRFHVRAPAHAKASVGGKSIAEPKGEAAYFEKEIMSKATVTGISDPKAKKPESMKATPLALTQDLFGNDGETEVNTAEKRPSMKVLESIFEPDSESSDSEKEIETSEAVRTGFQDQISGGGSHNATAATPLGNPDDVVAPVESTSALQDDMQQGSGRKGEDRKDRRRRKRRSRSWSPSANSGSDRSKRKRSRKREEKKKRKKRHKLSRRRNRANE